MAGSYDTVMDSRKALLDEMLALIKSGELNWERGWKAAALSPNNPVSGVTYRGGNRLRLMLASIKGDYDDPRFITYVQAKQKGWQVKKGEKGILCEKYIFTKQIEQENEITGQKEKVVVELDRPIINYFYVFNASQIEGIPELDNSPVNTDTSYEDILEDLIKASPCVVEERKQSQAYYSPLKDIIVMPPREMFYSNADFIKTLGHEMTHASGHKSRLNRDLSGVFGTPEYAREELRAELGALFLLADLGLPCEGKLQENHAAYLQSWLGALKDDPNELFHAANDAEKAADYLKRLYENVRAVSIDVLDDELKVTKNSGLGL